MTPNRVTEIEEVVREHTELIKTKFRYDHSAEKDWLREKLATLVEEAEERVVKKALQLVDEHDPNVGMQRDTSPAYWGNTLRRALQALTNHTV